MSGKERPLKHANSWETAQHTRIRKLEESVRHKTVWCYYETDGDAGWYAVTLFTTKRAAERYKRQKDDAYGHIEQLEVRHENHCVSEKRQQR